MSDSVKKIFIDGKAGTTGLRIYERLEQRNDIRLLTLSEEQRKDAQCRKAMLNEADVAFLCLPDDAAREAVGMLENDRTVIIDTSTAHRTADGWAYGFAELSAEFAHNIKNSNRIAVPGCHASGFIALIYPLVESGIIDADSLLSCFSLTGYSGGGKKMIAQYESDEEDALLAAPRQYGLSQQHKHLKEMQAICKINNSPVFCPVVDDFYSGMQVTVPLFASQLTNGKTVENIRDAYREKYTGPIVRFCDNADENGFLSTAAFSTKDSMGVAVYGNDERIILSARYDNLGKGASGAAIQCLNMVLGVDPTTGLEL